MNTEKLTIAERVRAAAITDRDQEGVNIADGRFGSAMASLCRELDALREELTADCVAHDAETDLLRKRLTIADQRNTELVELLQRFEFMFSGGVASGPLQELVVDVSRALKPTKSGASE